MKHLRTLLVVSVLIIGWFNPVNAQVPSGSLSKDQITGTALNANDRSVVVLIHGWNPDNFPDVFVEGDWPQLVNALKTRLNGTGSKLLLYNWENDASTGGIDVLGVPFGFGTEFHNASTAASRAFLNGTRLADSLNEKAPELRKITFIAHSAGSWAAYRAVDKLLRLNPFVVVNLVLLDPFIPGVNPSFDTTLNTERMSELASHPSEDRIFRLENYYANDPTDFVDWIRGDGSSANATSQRFTWRDRDIDGVQRTDNSNIHNVDFWYRHPLATVGVPYYKSQNA